jgi:NAD(P)-dependent dehydrogenase (short-subunit alcohol dehydrogenase family)
LDIQDECLCPVLDYQGGPAAPATRPTIINPTSVNAYDPSENLLDAMIKGTIMIFTKALAKQMAKKGSRVNGVAPGPFWTPPQVSGGQTEQKLVQFGADTPLGRPGRPAELAPVYIALAATDATFVTGPIYGASGVRGNP